MTYQTIWQTEDGLTHKATVTGNGTEGFEIRSDCGLAGNASWEKQLNDDAEISCPKCRSKSKRTEPQTKPGREQNGGNPHNGKILGNSPTTFLFQD